MCICLSKYFTLVAADAHDDDDDDDDGVKRIHRIISSACLHHATFRLKFQHWSSTFHEPLLSD